MYPTASRNHSTVTFHEPPKTSATAAPTAASMMMRNNNSSTASSSGPTVVSEQEQELYELRTKFEAATLLMHQNEAVIRRLELIVAGALRPAALIADATTDTSMDFGYDGLSGSPSPLLHVAQLEAMLERERNASAHERQEYLQNVGRMAAESVALLKIMGHYQNAASVSTIQNLGVGGGGGGGPMSAASQQQVPLDAQGRPTWRGGAADAAEVEIVGNGFQPLPLPNLLN